MTKKTEKKDRNGIKVIEKKGQTPDPKNSREALTPLQEAIRKAKEENPETEFSYLDTRLFLAEQLHEQTAGLLGDNDKTKTELIEGCGFNRKLWLEAMKNLPVMDKAAAEGLPVAKVFSFIAKLLYFNELKDGAQYPYKEEDKHFFKQDELQRREHTFIGAMTKLKEGYWPTIVYGIYSNHPSITWNKI